MAEIAPTLPNIVADMVADAQARVDALSLTCRNLSHKIRSVRLHHGGDTLVEVMAEQGKDAEYKICVPNSHLFTFTYADHHLKIKKDVSLGPHMTFRGSIDIFELCMVRAIAELRKMFQQDGLNDTWLIHQVVGFSEDEWRQRVGFIQNEHIFGPQEDQPRCNVTDYRLQLL